MSFVRVTFYLKKLGFYFNTRHKMSEQYIEQRNLKSKFKEKILSLNYFGTACDQDLFAYLI